MFQSQIVVVGNGAVDLQRPKPLTHQTRGNVVGPVPAQSTRRDPHVHLGVVRQRRTGDLVLDFELINIGVNRARGTGR